MIVRTACARYNCVCRHAGIGGGISNLLLTAIRQPAAPRAHIRQRPSLDRAPRVRLLGFALACLCGAAQPAAHAAEGFFTGDKPPAVARAWNSVYAFVCEGRKGAYTATAFPVKRSPKGERTEHYFITAGHAVEDCRGERRYLVEDTGGKRFEEDGITLAARPRRLEGVQPVRVDDAYDIAVIKITTRSGERIGSTLPLDGQCDASFGQEVYAIGFPGVAKRRSLRQSAQIKRWSRGLSVGLGHADFRGSTSTYVATSVDSLPGNSGGPVLAADGALVGVMVKGAAGPQNNFRYDVDPKKKDDWHSFLVPCQGIMRLLQQAGLR